MFDKLVEIKTIIVNNIRFDFEIRTITGKRISFSNNVILYDFDINNQNELEKIANLLSAILKNHIIMNKNQKILDDKTIQKLEDFDTIINLFNKYNQE